MLTLHDVGVSLADFESGGHLYSLDGPQYLISIGDGHASTSVQMVRGNTLVRLDASGKPVSYEPFAEGWLQGETAWGRPADVQVAPDGSLLIADDGAGAIYRVSYRDR